ncbi:MAG: MFS transporter [Sphaerochaetaceae bacterium]
MGPDAVCGLLDVPQAREEGSTFKALLSRPQLIWFSFGTLLCAFSYRQIAFSLPLEMTAFFGNEGARLYGTVISLNSFIVVCCNPFVLKWSRQHDIVRNLVLAAGIYAVSFTLFGFARIPWQFFLLTVCYTFGELMMSNNDNVYRVNNTPMNFRGRFGAVLKTLKDIGRFLSPLFGGLIIGSLSYTWLWSFAGIAAFVGMFCFAALRSKTCAIK